MMTEKKQPDITREIWRLFVQVRLAMVTHRARELRVINISPMQSALLYAVNRIPEPVTPAEISRWLIRERHTVSVALNQMEKKGLLTQVKDLERKNMIRVTLTQKGQETLDQLLIEHWNIIPEILSCLSDDEKANLRKYLLKLHENSFRLLGVSDKQQQQTVALSLRTGASLKELEEDIESDREIPTTNDYGQ